MQATRLSGLNWLRAGATLAVVMLHAAVPYTVAPMPGLAWPVGHRRTSIWLDGLFWAIAGWIIPLFFTISGYCAARAVSRVSPREFVARRLRRVLWPFLAAAAILLPVEFYLWLLGWVVDGRMDPRKLASLKLGPLGQDLWGFSHLWYLEYLFLLSLAYAGWTAWRWRRPLAQVSHPDRALSRRHEVSRAAMVAAVAAAVLWWSPETMAGFQHGFLPFPAKFAFSAVFFCYGVSLQERRPLPRAWGVAWIALGAVLFGLLWPRIHAQVAHPLAPWPRLEFALLAGALASAVSTGCWTLCVAHTAVSSRWADYLAGASFWVYLVHHPLIALAHITLGLTSWPAEGQFLAAMAIAIVLSLASYRVLVYRKWLGAFLEGQRVDRQPSVHAASAEESVVHVPAQAA